MRREEIEENPQYEVQSMIIPHEMQKRVNVNICILCKTISIQTKI